MQPFPQWLVSWAAGAAKPRGAPHAPAGEETNTFSRFLKFAFITLTQSYSYNSEVLKFYFVWSYTLNDQLTNPRQFFSKVALQNVVTVVLGKKS